jgi:predicted ATPase
MSFRIIESKFQERRIPLWQYNNRPANKYENCCTILIGRNGMGKSRLLAEICRAFISINSNGLMPRTSQRNIQGARTNQAFEIKYSYDEHQVELRFKGKRLVDATVDGVFVKNLESLPIPRRVIATTITPFDKFPIGPRRSISHTNDKNEDIGPLLYRYLGSKNNAGQLSSTGQLSRVIESLMFATEKSRSELIRLNQVFEFLGYYPKISVDYGFRMRQSMFEDLKGVHSQNTIFNRFIKGIKSGGSRTMLSLTIKIQEDQEFADELYAALMSVVAFAQNPKFLTLDLDFSSGMFNMGSIEIFKDVQFLRKNGLLSLSDMRLSSINADIDNISIKEASSGEQSIVLTLLGIASEIEDESLVIIDEPEISLHPEWQEKFIPLMTAMFSNYKGCHFLLATHSPQILSQAGDISSVVVTMDDLSITEASEFSKKSADYQLAEYFDAPGFRNEYLAREGLAALRLARRREFDSVEFKERIQMLSKVRPHLEDDDPVAHMTDALLFAAEDNFE